MIDTILQIIALILPWIMERFSKEASTRREHEAFDSALAKNDAALAGRLLSQRYDRVRGLRSESGRGAGQP